MESTRSGRTASSATSQPVPTVVAPKLLDRVRQALSALLFLYRDVLRIEIGHVENVPGARMPVRVPVVLSQNEVARIMKHLDGVTWIMVALLYGAGLRLQECLELRVKDIDLERRQIVIRRGNGQKDRPTVLPIAVVEPLARHLEAVKRQHQKDHQQVDRCDRVTCSLSLAASARVQGGRSRPIRLVIAAIAY